jgi:hypothetical protein
MTTPNSLAYERSPLVVMSFALEIDVNLVSIPMPPGAQILSMRVAQAAIFIDALATPNQARVDRHLFIAQSWQSFIPPHTDVAHVCSAQSPDGATTYHLLDLDPFARR